MKLGHVWQGRAALLVSLMVVGCDSGDGGGDPVDGAIIDATGAGGEGGAAGEGGAGGVGGAAGEGGAGGVGGAAGEGGAGGAGGVGGAAGEGGAGGAAGEGGAGGAPACEEGSEQACELDGCAGTSRCVGGDWGACVPPAELCNGSDDDCDGTTDEGFEGLGEACEAGQGVCLAAGTTVCNAAGDGVACDAVPGAAGAETCNGMDDDCNGMDDDGLAPEPCYGGPMGTAGVGVCRAGQQACVNGELGACVGSVIPSDQQCNGTDDDCDGQVDEGCPRCGDGVVEGDEACDDGNQVDGDGCSAQCGAEGVPLGANRGFGHHGDCESFNQCGDGRTCADAACALAGHGRATGWQESTCGALRAQDPNGDCDLFLGLMPPQLDAEWPGGIDFCNDIMVAYDVVCSALPEARADCARNPLWTPVACQTGEWVWSSDRAFQDLASAEANRALWTALVGDQGQPGNEARCSLDGQGFVSTEQFVMQACDSTWFHIGGRFTGDCGGHDGEPVRRLVQNPQGCFDYRGLPPPALPQPIDLGQDCMQDSDCAQGVCWNFRDYDRFCGGRACSLPCQNNQECADAFALAGAPNAANATCGADGRCSPLSAGVGAFFCQ